MPENSQWFIEMRIFVEKTPISFGCARGITTRKYQDWRENVTRKYKKNNKINRASLLHDQDFIFFILFIFLSLNFVVQKWITMNFFMKYFINF